MSIFSQKSKKHPGILTNHEINLMEAVADGRTPQQAADAIGLTRATVDADLKRIYPKLGVNTIREAVEAYRGSHTLKNAEYEVVAQLISQMCSNLDLSDKCAVAYRVIGLAKDDTYAKERAKERAKRKKFGEE